MLMVGDIGGTKTELAVYSSITTLSVPVADAIFLSGQYQNLEEIVRWNCPEIGGQLQKISGAFRSATGATAFCRIRSYLSTMQKQGHTMLSSLTAVFHGQPLPVAWGPE